MQTEFSKSFEVANSEVFTGLKRKTVSLNSRNENFDMTPNRGWQLDFLKASFRRAEIAAG